MMLISEHLVSNNYPGYLHCFDGNYWIQNMLDMLIAQVVTFISTPCDLSTTIEAQLPISPAKDSRGTHTPTHREYSRINSPDKIGGAVQEYYFGLPLIW